MYSAPAVSYPVGRSFFHGALLAVLLTVGASCLTAWIMQSDTPGLTHLAGVALWVISAGMALWAWWRSPIGLLTWDGHNWTWTGHQASQVVTFVVTMDNQSTLLLKLRTPDGSLRWVWLERRLAPARWLPLRRAVFARQPAPQSRSDGWAAP